ncbi:MAG: sulfatase [Bryobacteraceae bacterium]
MNRRDFLKTTAGAAPAILRGQQKPPNILFLLGDDHRWDALGCMGDPILRTPHIDALAQQGVLFSRNFVTTAICVTSRASFFTGLYARSHGIWEFRNEFPKDKWARSYPALLRQAGYRTGFIGKFGIDGGKPPVETFDYWRGFQGQGHYFPKNDGKTHLNTIMGDQVVEFLDGCRADQPFQLSVSFKAPHVQDEDPKQFLYDPQDEALYRDVQIPMPQTAAPGYISQLPLSVQRSEARRRWAVRFSTPQLYQESVKGYYRLITSVDRQVGRAVEMLRRKGLAENTIIVYTGDNGFYLAEHGLAGKWFMHEESIRTPLMICDPRSQQPRGRLLGPMALNIDIAPTLLDMAGIKPPQSMQGKSLKPAIDGKSGSLRNEFFYEHHFPNGGWIPSTEGIRNSRYKYTVYTDEPQRTEEFYDLEVDMWEETNLIGHPAQQERIAHMRARREAWLNRLKQWSPDQLWADPA